MGRVIVNKNFIQKEGDKIVFDSPDFCEIETDLQNIKTWN